MHHLHFDNTGNAEIVGLVIETKEGNWPSARPHSRGSLSLLSSGHAIRNASFITRQEYSTQGLANICKRRFLLLTRGHHLSFGDRNRKF